ncbi:MAG: threonyl-tRNA synthetase editing domain-containing protein [Desulfobacterales bacterium]
MRVLFWYCTRFDWVPASKTLEDAPEAVAAQNANVVVAFVQVEPGDPEPNSSAETKLVQEAKLLMENAAKRLTAAGYTVTQTPYGYFNDLLIEAPGHALARIYKQF